MVEEIKFSKTQRDKVLKEHFSKIGKKGGLATKKKKGKAYYQELGRKGGLVTKKKGTAHYQELSKKSVEARLKKKQNYDKT